MRHISILAGLLPVLLGCVAAAEAQPITADGQPARLDIRAAGAHSIRVTLKPVSFTNEFPINPALAERLYPSPALSVRALSRPIRKTVGSLEVEVRPIR